jgi:Fe-S-cluster containining protein
MTGAMDDAPLPAGRFSEWLAGMQRALAGDVASDVPCDGCTACCTSSQFVHIGPDETETLARVPASLRFAAPGLPEGHVVLGYDERGHCPMLANGACSIYDHRPRTCRTYDCRVFPAAGVELDDEAQAAIAERARRWRFDLTTDDDRTLHAAVRAAASHVRDRDGATTNATRHAVLAVELHEAFVGSDETT